VAHANERSVKTESLGVRVGEEWFTMITLHVEELAKPGDGDFKNELLLNETMCFEISELYVAKLVF
jgi:hypothetical protein